MRLAPRLVLAFGIVATLSATGVGYLVREDLRASETARFAREVESACRSVVSEMVRQAESDRKLVGGACQSGELVDRALLWIEAGTLDDQRRLALSRLVPEERQAFDLDRLELATGDGQSLGQDPPGPAAPSSENAAPSIGGADAFELDLAGPSLVTRCRKEGSAGRSVALVGARSLRPVADRLGNDLDVRVNLGAAETKGRGLARARCALMDARGTTLPVTVDEPRTELDETLARIDHTILYAALASVGVALVLAVLLARSLGRPIAELAAEARKVATGHARPLRVRGAGEITELAAAFDTMLSDLESTRRRLDASSRAAAWREVARRVAHEIKNPLAPIRAAVETLRRLHARHDPEFDAYFNEATRTVLDEVHRIAGIVTEFTRFARLPAPRPQPVDVAELAADVVRLHARTDGGPLIALTVEDAELRVMADRDQIVQVLTNLVQNALDAVEGQPGAREVAVTVRREGPSHVVVVVADSGSGIAPEIAPRLFEPYATTKAHGTGLGLAIAQRIAIEHAGELSLVAAGSAKSEANRRTGAIFRLVLPASGPRAPEALAGGERGPSS